MPTNFRPEHSFQALGLFFSRPVAPSPVREPQWIAFNQTLAEQLQLPADLHATKTGLNVWSGNEVPSWAQPIALAYAGHQFGNLVPQLGDGRALLLAEAIDKQGKRWDIQLKGAGPTEFSRGGDGRSAIGPVLREYLLSESMFVLGCADHSCASSCSEWRIGFFVIKAAYQALYLPAFASSHLRIGSFQFASLHGGNNGGSNGSADKVQVLADYAIARHYPETRRHDRRRALSRLFTRGCDKTSGISQSMAARRVYSRRDEHRQTPQFVAKPSITARRHFSTAIIRKKSLARLTVGDVMRFAIKLALRSGIWLVLAECFIAVTHD